MPPALLSLVTVTFFGAVAVVSVDAGPEIFSPSVIQYGVIVILYRTAGLSLENV